MTGLNNAGVRLAVLALLCVAGPSRAATVTQLEALELAARQTRDHHAALALAFRSEGKPSPASEALAVFDQLPSPASPVDLEPLRKWIAAKAVDEYKAALVARDRGDNAAAVKSYLRAIMLDPGIQARDDHGLRDLAATSLDSAVAKKKDDAGLRFKHALVQYQFGKVAEAEASFAAYLGLEKSPYHLWRGRLWHARVKAELATMKAQDAQNEKAHATQRAREAVEDALAAEKVALDRAAAEKAAAESGPPSPPPESAGSPEVLARRKVIQDQIDKLDLAIAGAANVDAVKGAAPAKYGKLIERLVNSGAGQAKLNELKARRAALQQDLANVK